MKGKKDKVKYNIIRSWECEATAEEGLLKTFVGIQFNYNNSSNIHTIFLLKDGININKIKKAIKDYYKQTIKRDEYEGMTGEFEPDEEV